MRPFWFGITTWLHVGTWVLCDPVRNPRQVAWEVGSLDRLTGGRFELGMGAGRAGAEQDALAVGNAQHPWLQRVGLAASQLAAARAVTLVTGTPWEIADTLLQRRDRFGPSYLTVLVESADTFASVVELLAGR